MRKLFAAFCAASILAASAAALTPEFFFDENSPALPEASRLEQRNRIISDVIDEKMTLLQAAAAFHELDNQSSPLVVSYAGSTDGEKACRRVISWVKTELERRAGDSKVQQTSMESNDEAAEVLARLEAQLSAAKDKGFHLEAEAS
jgi:hypothetical protein